MIFSSSVSSPSLENETALLLISIAEFEGNAAGLAHLHYFILQPLVIWGLRRQIRFEQRLQIWKMCLENALYGGHVAALDVQPVDNDSRSAFRDLVQEHVEVRLAQVREKGSEKDV